MSSKLPNSSDAYKALIATVGELLHTGRQTAWQSVNAILVVSESLTHQLSWTHIEK